MSSSALSLTVRRSLYTVSSADKSELEIFDVQFICDLFVRYIIKAVADGRVFSLCKYPYFLFACSKYKTQDEFLFR